MTAECRSTKIALDTFLASDTQPIARPRFGARFFTDTDSIRSGFFFERFFIQIQIQNVYKKVPGNYCVKRNMDRSVLKISYLW